MKKLISVLLLLSVVLCFSSCKKEEEVKSEREIPKEAEQIAHQLEELATNKDPSVLENLSEPQKKYFDSIGETDEGKKLVAYSDTVHYTLVYECKFKDNVVSSVTVYRIIKNDAYFNAIKSGINAKSEATVDKKNKVIKADKTKDYKSKTYDEMVKEFSKYTIVE